MSIIEHAKRELTAIGAMADWPIYEPILKVFCSQGHSGGSASVVIPTLNKLLKQEPLSDITNNPDEWLEVTEMTADGTSLHQSRRRSTSFSRDGGKTWYDIDNSELNNGDVWVREK